MSTFLSSLRTPRKMTIVVGIQANYGTGGIVLVADEQYTIVHGNRDEHELLDRFAGRTFTRQDVQRYCSKYDIRSSSVRQRRKIHLSVDNKYIVAQSGSRAPESELSLEFLRDPSSLHNKTQLLGKLLCPGVTDRALRSQIVAKYRSAFSFDRMLRRGFSPELQGLYASAFAKEEHELRQQEGALASADPTWRANEYILATPHKRSFGLYHISWSGCISASNIVVIGSGAQSARQRLSKSPRSITLDHAYDLALTAVRQACKKDIYCSGLQSAILTHHGIQYHREHSAQPRNISLVDLLLHQERQARNFSGLARRLRQFLR
jgi:hypothetical protein